MAVLWSILLSALVIVGTTVIHYEGIRRMDDYARAHTRGAYPTLLAVIVGLVVLHLVEIGLYAGLFAFADGPLDIGAFHGGPTMGALDYFYYAAEAYASLGYGDVYPMGAMRLIGAVAPLNGLLLLAWSGCFLFSMVEEWRRRD
jgi:hypothetical protein